MQMFEHMKNYEVLLKKVASWLRPADEKDDPSLLFIHIFCHRSMPYHFEESDGWMAQMFFSGGTMPSFDMLVRSLCFCVEIFYQIAPTDLFPN